MSVLSNIRSKNIALSLPEIMHLQVLSVSERTVRRWLVQWVNEGQLTRTGQKRGTRYQSAGTPTFDPRSLTFLRDVPMHRRQALLQQIRDLWTHSSTALEGNTLTLGDTHFILEEGLTVSGKPLREHQEVIGHAHALDLMYHSLHKPIDRAWIFELHKAVQTEHITDIYKPNGAWKVEPNGRNVLTKEGRQQYLEYVMPAHVDALMQQMFDYMNTFDTHSMTIDSAPKVYAKVHMAVAHIHPFWDGNGRVARLVANNLLLKAGLPPLIIDQANRREYIQTLANYQLAVGQLTPQTGLWPQLDLLESFNTFCQNNYYLTQQLISNMMN